MALESAICPHLQKQRTQERSTPANYEPGFPLFSARFDPAMEEMAAVLIGAIAKEPGRLEHDALEPVDKLLQKGAPLPHYAVLCSSEDPAGRETRAWKAYWRRKEDYLAWSHSSGFETWWKDEKRQLDSDQGWMLEALFPTMDRFEAVFSSQNAREGASLMCEGMSEPIEEHGYWGSARDRLPIGQVDPVRGDKCPVNHSKTGVAQGLRVVVPGKKNLCVIHSGQDWSAVEGKERSLYLDTLHPTLEAGMRFLSNDQYPDTTREHFGCFDCRFMAHLDPETLEPSLSKTFGLCYFDDLANLERWSKEHKTHLNIFNGFFKYATDTQGKGNLSLWHEVTVLEESQQFFEYVNCPPGTGMLSL